MKQVTKQIISLVKCIAVEDQIFLGMHYFDFAQIYQICPNVIQFIQILPNFTQFIQIYPEFNQICSNFIQILPKL